MHALMCAIVPRSFPHCLLEPMPLEECLEWNPFLGVLVAWDAVQSNDTKYGHMFELAYHLLDAGKPPETSLIFSSSFL